MHPANKAIREYLGIKGFLREYSGATCSHLIDKSKCEMTQLAHSAVSTGSHSLLLADD